MKLNLPVTGREFDYDPGQMLVSMTDLKGRIVHANDAFVAVSGYAREEILGKAHNIVRHPDMPPAAFADLWTTIGAGLPWTALVKNRRKDGDHYWVRANVTPVMADGTVTGYLSVRVKPARDEVEAAEALYRDLRDGKAPGVSLRGGRVRHAGARGLAGQVRRVGMAARLMTACGACAAVPVVGAALGLDPWTLAGGAVLAGGLAAAWLVNSVARPLTSVRDAVRRLAAADLSVQLASAREDELGEISRGLTQMALNLTAVVQDVSSGAAVLTTATSEIATGNSDLSQRTETQAANLEQTAASMEQLNATVKNSAASARKATQIAGSASEAATRGGEMMGQVVSTMDEIAASSDRISVIIGVIDGIAFQTNILALNAAVEAARAGEQGRGFAVVAAEVRSLAQRSAEAAKEIKGLIGASVDRVEAGSKLVRSAGSTMDDIVLQVRNVAHLIEEISAATNEQTTGIGQVNDAVNQLDQVTQQNAALVEQAAAAAESLNQQATRLVESVSVFSLGHREAASTIARAQTSSKLIAPKVNAVKALTPDARMPAAPTAPVAALSPAPARPMASVKADVDEWESF